MGIPKEEFEGLMTEYLPVTAQELEQYAAFDPESGTYEWAALGSGNYAPDGFCSSLPEIAGMQENEDGTVTLTIDAGCEAAGDDAVISHKLTVRFLKDGSIRYLEKQVPVDDLERIPAYQYRIAGDGRETGGYEQKQNHRE